MLLQKIGVFVLNCKSFFKVLCLLSVLAFGVSCTSASKNTVSEPLGFPTENSAFEWKELNASHERIRPYRGVKGLSKTRYLKAKDYLKRVAKTVRFKRAEIYREGLLATTHKGSLFYVASKNRLDERSEVSHIIVKILSERLKCFANRKVDTPNLKAFQCRDGRVVKFLFKKDADLAKIAAHTYKDIKLEWLALESSFNTNQIH